MSDGGPTAGATEARGAEAGAPVVLEYGRSAASTSRRGRGALAVAATLFLPGLGHALAGRRGRGVKWLLAMLLVTAVIMGLLLWPAGTAVGFVLIAPAAVLQLALLIDAYRTGRRAEGGRVTRPLARYASALLFVVAAGLAAPMGWVAEGFRAYGAQAFHVPTAAMAPAIEPGDRVLCNKVAPVRRWDVAVFRMPSGPLYVMRAVGLPGETVEIRGGQVYVDGQLAAAPAGVGPYREPPYPLDPPRAGEGRPFKLGPDEYFVLGDDSARSFDSRYWRDAFPGHQAGAVPAAQVVGRVTFTYWPLGRFGGMR